MSGFPELKLDWCSHEAAKFAVENWHYSKCMPAGKTVKIGVWESGEFIGCVIFSRGATPEIGSPYGLKQTEICELTRVALSKHTNPVSRILSIAMKLVRKNCPGIKLIVSFADSTRGHHGGIYQATGWTYAGASDTHVYRVLGRTWHPKSLHSKFGKGGQSIPWLKENIDPLAERISGLFKHRYLMPLDNEMDDKIKSLARVYPKRARSVVSDTVGFQSTKGGAIPTLAHQLAGQEQAYV